MDLAREVQRQLDFPGIQQLLVGVKREAARRNVPVPTRAQVAEAVRTSAERQIFKSRAGKSGQAAVYAFSKNQYWQLDLIDMGYLSQEKKYVICLIATDVYSRFITVKPLKGETSEIV